MDPQNPAPGTWCCEDSRLHHNPSTMWNNLAGFTGLLVRGYLPQRWVFETGQERASLIVDVNGNTEVALGVVESADVLITTTHDTLSSALEAANGLRSRDSVIRGAFMPRFYTAKGEIAFNFLRSRLLL